MVLSLTCPTTRTTVSAAWAGQSRSGGGGPGSMGAGRPEVVAFAMRGKPTCAPAPARAWSVGTWSGGARGLGARIPDPGSAQRPLRQHPTAGVDDHEPSRLGRPDAPHADGHAADDTVPHEQRPGTGPLERIGHAGRARGRGGLGGRVGVVPRAEDTRRVALGLGALAGGVEEVVGGRERAEVGGAASRPCRARTRRGSRRSLPGPRPTGPLPRPRRPPCPRPRPTRPRPGRSRSCPARP